MGQTAKKTLIDVIVGLVIAIGVCAWGGLFQAESLEDVLRILSDGFFVAAALLLGCGGLQWTYNGGVMDGLVYSFKTFFNRFRADYEDRRQSFRDYREQREAKASTPKYLLYSGLIHLVISIAILLLYMTVI